MVTVEELLADAAAARVGTVTVGRHQFHVRKFGYLEVMAISKRAREGQAPDVPEWLALGVCTEDGSPFFTPESALQYAEADGPSAVRLADAVASKVFGQEDAAKNSEATPSG